MLNPKELDKKSFINLKTVMICMDIFENFDPNRWKNVKVCKKMQIFNNYSSQI